ncbi:glyoxalase [Dactylosporangium matsuzakiense]|uniref:Glyoxalase n=1 Tax=Dactylosporangium matsuzakiense TaxID=53360 RepID=A0A9W6KJQ7_9ACTN|nr:glyoxalase [Dactylosporangium matsuzakiense]
MRVRHDMAGSVHGVSHLVEIVLDCGHASELARFWAAALGWQIRPYDEAEVARLAALGLTPQSDPTVAIDSPDGSLVFFLQQVPETKRVKNRMHVDIRLRDQDHLDELMRLGATVVSEHDGWRVLADPEGNEFCAKQPE